MYRTNALFESLETRRMLADASVVKDILAGTDSSISFASGARFDAPAALGSKLVFPAIDDDHAKEPWVSDGTSAGTFLLKDINPGGTSDARDFTPGNGVVYFIANNGTKDEVWRTNGTVAGTVKVSNAPGNANLLHYYNGKLFFGLAGSDDGIFAISDAGTQSTVSSTLDLFEWVGDVGTVSVFKTAVIGNDALYASNGGAATVLFDPAGSGTFTVEPGATVNGQLVFGMTFQTSGDEVWRTNGTAAGTQLLADLASAAFTGSQPHDFVAVGAKVFFVADPSSDGSNNQIYNTDGTSAGIVTSLANTGDSQAIRDLTNVNGTLFFTYSEAGSARRLYKLVGGTTATAIPLGASGGTGAGRLTAIGGNVYFNGFDSASHAKLFVSNGSAITLVGGDTGTDPAGLTNANGHLFFQGTDDAKGSELRVLIDSDSQPPPPPLTARIKVFANAQGHTTTLDEGESITLEAITTGPSIKAYYWDFGDGVLVRSSRKPTKTYNNNFLENAARRLRVKVVAADNTFVNAYLDNFVVKNVAPKIKFFVPATFVTFAPMPWSATVTDPGKDADEVKVRIFWGDGAVDEVTPVNGKVGGIHVFTSPQLDLHNIRAYANDKDGETDNKFRTVPIASVARFLPDNPVNQLLGLSGIYFGGSTGNDRMKIQKVDHSGRDTMIFIILATQLSIDDVEDDEQIYVFGGTGNDRVETIGPGINPVYANGGAGNDTLIGGLGNDFLVGGAGIDKTSGGGGKNRLKP